MTYDIYHREWTEFNVSRFKYNLNCFNLGNIE